MIRIFSLPPIVGILLLFSISACVPTPQVSNQQERQLQATISALETRVDQQENRTAPSISEQQLQATVSALQTQIAQQITPSVTTAISPTASEIPLEREVTPSPTLAPDTPPDSILEVGESWRQGDLMLTLLSFSFVTDDTKWSINEPLGILTVWKITNKGTTPVLVTFRSAEQFSAKDNLGRTLGIEGFRTGFNTCAAFVHCDVTFVLEPGQSRHLSCGRDDCPPGLKIDVNLSDPEVTEVIITVNIGTIKDARWRVKIR